MKKKITTILCVLAVTIMIGISNIGALSARELQPGSSEDPVVTKGYVDKLIRDLQINGNANGSVSGTGNNTYEVVDVNPGDKLVGKQGTEIILRAGQGTAVISELGGLQDMTDGVDITGGFVPKYHLIIIPRDDGRGIFVTKEATFMVRGGYTIE